MSTYIITALLAVASSAILTRLIIRLNIVDEPGSRSSHTHPTPRGGGLAIIGGFFIGMIAIRVHPSLELWSLGMIVSAILGLVLISLFDDFRSVPYRFRLIVQAIVSMMIVAAGLKIHLPTALPFLDVGLTVLGLMFLINASNFIDGLNGLLSGSVLIALVFIAWIAYIGSSLWIIQLCWGLAWAILGFFFFNFPKAKIFLGDVGSTFLGLMVGILALSAQDSQIPTLLIDPNFFLTLFPLSFIWVDVTFTLLRRAILRRPLTQAHRDHLYQLLHRSGWSHAQVSSLYFIGTTLLGMLSVLCALHYLSLLQILLLYGMLQIILILFVFSKEIFFRKY